MSSERVISGEDAEQLHEDDDGSTVGEWTRIRADRKGSGRWMENWTLVLRHSDGTFWGLAYQYGLTENQDSSFPWKGRFSGALTDVPLHRLYPHEVTVTEYRKTPPPMTGADQ